MGLVRFFAGFLLVLNVSFAHAESTAGSSGQVENLQYPLQKEISSGHLSIYTPQVISWDDYKTARLLIAVEYSPKGEDKTVPGTVKLSGHTEVDLEERTVTFSSPQIEKAYLTNNEGQDYSEKLQTEILRDKFIISLDIFLISLAQDVLAVQGESGFNQEAPPIYVENSPTILLFITGEPILKEIPDTGLDVVANANWPLVKEKSSGHYFLLNQQTWMTSANLDSGWKLADSAPRGVANIDNKGPYKQFVVTQTDTDKIRVRLVDQPSEIIVIDGQTTLEEIPETTGLQFVTNTQSPVFKFENNWYYLVAGRWFTTDDIDNNRWQIVHQLPPAFSMIPAGHGMAYVRVSVANTLEANTAIFEASLPKRKVVKKSVELGADSGFVAEFYGTPEFLSIADTGVARATNTPHQIFAFSGVYYLCYEGAWYQSGSSKGPWLVADSVPDQIYQIPASSPGYRVTDVTVESTTPTTVTYNFSPAYSSGMYVSSGVVVYGTGWYYPAYYYPAYYGYYSYPYYSYGYGSYYNPNTGRYNTRSAWYGPYGGYSYNEFANHNTGRYGYIETAWDHDEWASYGETYNPRTDVRTETSRHYDEDRHRLNTERDISKGEKTMHVEREADFNNGWSTVDRTTSKGGSSSMSRHRESDGSISSQGTISNSEGKTADISSTISDGIRTTSASGEDGGQVLSKSNGDNKFSIARNSQDDLYAGHNGDVYKKGEDGWEKYDKKNSSWETHQFDRDNINGSNVSGFQAAQEKYKASRDKHQYQGSYQSLNRSKIQQPYKTQDRHQPKTHTYKMQNRRTQYNLNRDAMARRQGTSQYNRHRITNRNASSRIGRRR